MSKIIELLGNEADYLLNHKSETISKEQLYLPSSDFVDRVFMQSDRSISVLKNLQTLYGNGRLANTGYLSILPVDQGVEHCGGAVFSANPKYFDPENIIKLGIEAGCSAVATTLGVLGIVARKYAHKIPFILKINHNELLSYPNTYNQIMFADIDQAVELGAVAVGATIYFGSKESERQIQEVSRAFHYAHKKGLATILWAYLRNSQFKTNEKDYHVSSDLTGQAIHLSATIEADIIKQKLPQNNGGFKSLCFGKKDERMYTKYTTEHPIDLARYQVMNSYMGRIGLINSGGASGENDLAAAVRTAVINKRAGGMGLILGRKAFQKPINEGIEIINAVQDVYLDNNITIA